MILRYALLGLLSDEPASGYDLKKKIIDSAILYWSGNNQQIYRTLIQLEEEGSVRHQVVDTDHLPVKKVYSITEQGLSELTEWLRSEPELPGIRHTFLIQLNWAGLLDDEELDSLLGRYEDEVRMELAMQQENAQRRMLGHRDAPRVALIRKRIVGNRVSFYESELEWIRGLRHELNI